MTVNLEGKGPQMSRQLELPLLSRGEAPRVKRSEEAPTATQGNERSGTSGLLELALTRENLQAALKGVKKNKGSPGIDGMTVDELPDHLRAHWSELREQLLSGAYRPSMVKEQLIPKGNGGMRKLGIPTVLDRCCSGSTRNSSSESTKRRVRLPSPRAASYSATPLGCARSLGEVPNCEES